jgi:hypothetical protein
MSYPGGGGGYGYSPQYTAPGTGYPHHGTALPSQVSPYGQGGHGVMGGQAPPQFAGLEDQFHNKPTHFPQSFQRPYSPASGFGYGAHPGMRHPQVGGQFDAGSGRNPMAVDLTSHTYSEQMYPAAQESSSPYGYNGCSPSQHSVQSSYNSPDPSRPVDYYYKSSGEAPSPKPVENVPSRCRFYQRRFGPKRVPVIQPRFAAKL